MYRAVCKLRDVYHIAFYPFRENKQGSAMRKTAANTLLALLLWRPSSSNIGSLALADLSSKKIKRNQNTMRRRVK
jgi:hypothetical protein